MKPVECAQFERWLDAGADAVAADAVHAHAASCPDCAAAWTAMAEADAWMSAPIAAPAGFTAGVMARIAHEAPLAAPLVADVLPWWVQVTQQPAVVLSAVLAALLMWRGSALVTAGAAGAMRLLQAGQAASAATAGWTAPFDGHGGLSLSFGSPSIATLGVALGLAPLAAMASLLLAEWVARRVAR